MTIEHPEYGRVVGVEEAILSVNGFGEQGWHKDGAFHFASKGWREVEQARDVTDQWNIGESGQDLWDRDHCTYPTLPEGHKWRKVQAVVLPEEVPAQQEMLKRWGFNDEEIQSIVQFFYDHRAKVLQIWEGER